MSAEVRAVEALATRILRDEIGGAAELAEEALKALSADIRAADLHGGAALEELVEDMFRTLLRAAPSVSPLTNVLHRVGAVLDAKSDLAEPIDEALVRACNEAISWIRDGVAVVGRVGSEMVRDGERIFTYSTSGSVVDVVTQAHAAGKRVTLVTTEARPVCEGLRTVQAMRSLGVPVVLGIDGGVAGLLRKCDSMWVGADTISSAGGALCKTGTLPAAMAAFSYGVPVHVAADSSKYDPATAEGSLLPVRHIERSALGASSELEYADVEIPLFELIPAQYVTDYVTELGVVHPGGVSALVGRSPASTLVRRLVSSATGAARG